MSPYTSQYIKALKGKNDDLKNLSFKIKKTILKWNKQRGGAHYRATSDSNRLIVIIYDGMIYLDNLKAFDKTSTCPIQLPFPSNQVEYDELLNYTKWVEDDEDWYDISNSYQWDKFVNAYSLKQS
jgi:hypothetical protein